MIKPGDLPSITIIDACIDYNDHSNAFVAFKRCNLLKQQILGNVSPTWTQVYDPTGDYTDPIIKRIVTSQANSSYVYGLM